MGAFKEDIMTNYETYEAAQKSFSVFAGKYVILRYGYKTWSERIGSRRHGRTYCHTGYCTEEDAYHIQYELFQVGKRGGLKRLHLVARKLPEGTPFVSNMKPDRATCCEYEDGSFFVNEELQNALIESVPDVEWKDGPGPISKYHSMM